MSCKVHAACQLLRQLDQLPFSLFHTDMQLLPTLDHIPSILLAEVVLASSVTSPVDGSRQAFESFEGMACVDIAGLALSGARSFVAD